MKSFVASTSGPSGDSLPECAKIGVIAGNKDNKMVFQLLNISHQVKVNGREED